MSSIWRAGASAASVRFSSRTFRRDNTDGDLLRQQRRIVRHMVGIAHEKLQRVRAGRQIDYGLGLSEAEMQMILVVRNG